MVGGVISIVELFVTERAEKDSASLPALSWIAKLLIVESIVGALYESVTTCALCTAVTNVSTTVEMFPADVAEFTATGLPSTNTV